MIDGRNTGGLVARLAAMVGTTLLQWAERQTSGTGVARWQLTMRAPAAAAVPYAALHTYLERRYASRVVLTFEQIEALLGFALPARACSEREWWTSPGDQDDRHAEAWTVAGRTAQPNLLARNVAFDRP